MIELSPEIVTLLIFSCIIVGALFGFPLFVVLGITGLVIGYALFGNLVFNLMYTRLFHMVTTYILLALPIFIFMGIMLERSGIAAKMYDALYLWLSGFRGGLAVITVLIGTIMAACVGIIGASVTMLALLALPAMLKRGYSKSLATGAVCAGGSLGILIPPSVMLIVYGPMAEVSVGKLFFGAMGPGLLLSFLYCLYISVRCFLQPSAGPAIPREERTVSFTKKTWVLLSSMVPPILIILAVLGSIFMGIAAPTEAAAVGAFAVILLSIAHRSFSFKALKTASLDTMRITSAIMIIGGCAVALVGVFISAGCKQVVAGAILSAPGGRWGAFLVVMLIYFLLGFFLDWIGIMFIMVPILAPIAPILGFDPLWFGIMICTNLQMSFMTPPFAPAIFYVRSAVSPEMGITMGDIIRGVIPFVFIIAVGLGICIAQPEVILWLPRQMIK